MSENNYINTNDINTNDINTNDIKINKSLIKVIFAILSISILITVAGAHHNLSKNDDIILLFSNKEFESLHIMLGTGWFLFIVSVVTLFFFTNTNIYIYLFFICYL